MHKKGCCTGGVAALVASERGDVAEFANKKVLLVLDKTGLSAYNIYARGAAISGYAKSLD